MAALPLPPKNIRYSAGVARQNGKTTVMSVLVAWWLFVDSGRHPELSPAWKFLVVGAAQTLDNARAPYQAVLNWCNPNPASEGEAANQTKLLANAVAQAEALMVGKPERIVREELAAQGLDAAAIDVLAPQKTFHGNRPSSFLLLEKLTPQALGALIALYEHKTFVEGVLWEINSFDQWGVELGKTLASRILKELEGAEPGAHDPSTAALVARLKR